MAHEYFTDHRSFVEPLSQHVNALHLTGGAESATLDVSDHNVVRITVDGNGAWMRVNGTAVKPTGDITDETASEYIPPNVPRIFFLGGVTTLSFILNNGTTIVSYALFHHRGF